MQAVILAGGKGTRISSVRSDVPKPMIEICSKPILQYQIENLRRAGILKITIIVGYLGRAIKNYFLDGKKFGVSIKYFEEEKPLGTAGALLRMFRAGLLKEDFLLLCGDIIFDVDFLRFINFHKEKNAFATLAAHPNSHPYDSSLLVTEILSPQKKGGLPVETFCVKKWISKEDAERKTGFFRNLVNAGLQIISPKLLLEFEKNRECGKWVPRHKENLEKIDLDRDILKNAIESKKIFAYKTSEYILDMGTPERFFFAERDIKEGKVFAKSFLQKQRAIFLDRDGTINKKNGFITHQEQFELSETAASAIKKINNAGFLAICVTNQPVIARGDCSFLDLQKIHNKMESELGKGGAYLDAIYFCPHHTDKGFLGERPEYKCDCDCRKPKPGLFFKAARDFNIDLSESFMIGDSENDALSGRAAGVKRSILLKEGMSLLDAVEEILK